MHVLQQIAVVHCFFFRIFDFAIFTWNWLKLFMLLMLLYLLQSTTVLFILPHSPLVAQVFPKFLLCWQSNQTILTLSVTHNQNIWFVIPNVHWTSLDIIGHHWTSFHYSQIFPGVHPIHSIVPEASHASHVRLHGQNNWNPPTRCKKGVWRDDSSSNTNNTSHATNNGSELRRRYNKLAGVSW